MAKKKSSSSDLGVSGGKGDVPRSCFSQQFRDNYDEINWDRDIEIIETEANDEIKCNTYSPKPS